MHPELCQALSIHGMASYQGTHHANEKSRLPLEGIGAKEKTQCHQVLSQRLDWNIRVQGKGMLKEVPSHISPIALM